MIELRRAPDLTNSESERDGELQRICQKMVNLTSAGIGVQLTEALFRSYNVSSNLTADGRSFPAPVRPVIDRRKQSYTISDGRRFFLTMGINSMFKGEHCQKIAKRK